MLKIVWSNFYSYTEDMRNVKQAYNENVAGYVTQEENERQDGYDVVYYSV